MLRLLIALPVTVFLESVVKKVPYSLNVMMMDIKSFVGGHYAVFFLVST